MKYCDKCKVSVISSADKCPLCQGIIEEGPADDVFPYVPTIYKKYHFFFRLLVFVSAMISGLCIFINALFPTEVYWSLFVLAAFACLLLLLRISIGNYKNIPKTILWLVVAISLLSLLWDYFTGWHGWSITYEKMKQYVKNDLDNGDKLILDTAKYVLENDEFKKMSDISEKMGKIAVKLSDAIICSKYDDDDVKDLLKIMKVKNAVMDLQMAVERSGLKVFLLKNAQFLSMNDEYELELRKSNYVPYIGEHKPELCNKGMNDIFIDLVDRMMFVQYMMLMGIFEGFWDILIELSKEDGVEGNLSQPNGIRRGSFIHKNIGKEIVNKEAWMYKIHDDKDSFYFLANKRIIHIEKNEGKSEVYGIAYPKEDIGLFEKEIVTE